METFESGMMNEQYHVISTTSPIPSDCCSFSSQTLRRDLIMLTILNIIHD